MPGEPGKEEPRKRTEDFGAIDVADLMAQVVLTEPKGTITVSGTVAALWEWPTGQKPTHVYGNLRSLDRQFIMSFRCPVAAAPRLVEEYVTLRGTLTIKTNLKQRGFDLQLRGTRIGEWAPNVAPITSMAALNRTRTKVLLEHFLLKDTGKDLVIIGTETAIDDAQDT